MARTVVAILGIVVVAIFVIYGFQAALATAGKDYVVTNETWQPDAGNVTQLENSGLPGGYYGNETAVYDENQTLQDRGTDYVWFQSNGTVKALTGGGLDGDSSATISYTYQQTTEEQRGMAKVLNMVPTFLVVVIPLLGVGLLLSLLS